MQEIVLVESALIGTLASILGVVSGLVLSLVLTYVINKAFFGWTIQFSVPWLTVLATPAWILVAALVAGWLPRSKLEGWLSPRRSAQNNVVHFFKDAPQKYK